jgi:hypothetical protein
MTLQKIISKARIWLKRLALAYMLGFASAMNIDTKRMEDTAFKIEQTQDVED